MITRGHAVWFARNYYPTEKSYNGKKGRKRNEVLPPFSISLVNPSPLSSLMQRKVHKRRKIEKSERWLGKSQVAEKKKKKKRKEKKTKDSQIPSQDLKLIVLKMLCRHLTKVSLTMVVRLLLDDLYALLYLVFFHHIHLTTMPSLRQRLAQQGTGGSVSFTWREARVRFPPVRFYMD